MKANTKYLKSFCFSGIITSALIIASCSIDKKNEENVPNPDQYTVISLTPIIQNDFVQNEINPIASVGNTVSDNKENYGDYVGLSESSDFDVAMFVKSPVSKNTYTKSAISKENLSKNKVAVSALGQGIKYRIYLKNRNTGNWQTKIFSSASTSGADTIRIYNVHNYDWYAYSNNTNADADVPDIRSGNTLNVISQNKDLLWAKGEILASNLNSNARLNILFKHMLARLEMQLDYRGVFAASVPNHTFNLALTAVGGATSTLKTSTLDLTTGTFNGTHTNYTPTMPTVVLPDNNFPDIRKYYFYSSQAQVFGTARINYTNLSYITHDGVTMSYNTAANKSVTITRTGANNITTAIGGNTQLNFLFIEAPVRSGTTNPTRWARANLYYKASDTRTPYRFRNQSIQGNAGNNTPSNTYTTSHHRLQTEDMFMLNSLIPNTFMINGAGNTPEGDPCLRILPLGAWKTPAPADFANLINTLPTSNPDRAIYFKTTEHLCGIFNSANVGVPYRSQYLIFERNGLINATNLTVTSPNTGLYWTTELTAVTVPALFNISGNSSATLVPRISQTCANVRCVRTNLYP